MCARPAALAASQRRSPATSSYLASPRSAESGRTTTGCSTPTVLIESASCASASFEKRARRISWMCVSLGVIDVRGMRSARAATAATSALAGAFMRSAFVVVVLEEERGDRLGLRLAEDVRLAAVDDDEARVLVDGGDEALGRRRALARRSSGGPRAFGLGLGAARPLGVLRLAALG